MTGVWTMDYRYNLFCTVLIQYYAKFKCCVAAIKIETCKYGLNLLPVWQTIREGCQIIEDECHVVMHCICTFMSIYVINYLKISVLSYY